MQNHEEESAFSLLTQLPIAPFSSFLNDLNRPFFLNNLLPSTEIVRTGVNFPDSAAIEVPEFIPSELFDCSSFNPSKIILNTYPVKEITHEYDEFMLKVLEQCYDVKFVHSRKERLMTIPNPIVSVPTKTAAHKKSDSTPKPLKVKLNVTNGSSSSSTAGPLLKKLIKDESFVNPLCFDCEEDLIQIARLIRSFSFSPPQADDFELVESICPTLSNYLVEVLEHLDQTTESIDPIKAAYCICLIGLLNIGRLSSKETLKDYNSFDLVFRFYSLTSDKSSFDSILSVVIESYVALLNKFKIHDAEVSSYSSHMFYFCFESFGLLSGTSSIIALSQVFSKYPEYRTYLIDQLLMKSSDSESFDVQKLSITIISSCLQALCTHADNTSNIASVSSIISSCLNYFWKGDGHELPKSSNIFFLMMDELQTVFSDFNWPIASTVLNQCAIQMFHYLLKEESTASSKGSLFLKLRLLDVLSNISKVVSSDASCNYNHDKSSFWQAIGQNPFFSTILSPKSVFESLNSTIFECDQFDQETFSSFLRSACPLVKIPERVTGLFIKLISSEVIQLRSKAIKNLFNLMNSAQLSKSNYDALRMSILLKATDPSISVRDAGLEFISKLIFTPPPFETDPNDLMESVLSRIKDRGVSVRKRAVKVIGEILQKGIANRHEMKFTCVGSLISHISDEDDEVVIEMIFKTLKDQWIMCYLGKDFIKMQPVAQRKLMSTFAEEVVKVIGFLKSDIKCLQDFLGRFLVDEKIKKDYSVFFSGTVEVLLENLLRSLEENDIKSLKSSLESISLFSESNPQSLECHLGLLQSLLRSDDPEISLLAMKLISTVIPKASLTEMKKLKDFEKDLLCLIYRGSEICLKLSIETLYHYVNNCSHQYATLSGLWQKFTDYLKSRDKSKNIEPSTIPHICRALLATGVLCAQSAHHREREFGLKDFHSGAQARCLLDFVGFFSRIPINFIRSCSIQAFGFLLAVCPQISISSSQICKSLICTSLSEIEDDSCKVKTLLIFDQMIKRFEGISSTDNTENIGNTNILSMEGDESYFSALIQEHLSSICNCVIFSESFEVRATALKICSSSAIFGLVNPQLIIPYLAIGLNSENDHIQAYSRSSYDRLLTRTPSLVGKDLLIPSKLLFSSQSSVQSPSLSSQSRLSFYYSSLKVNGGKNSIKFAIESLNGVFTLFESIISISRKDQDEEEVMDLSTKYSNNDDYIKFLIEIVFTLPFTNSEEVLHCLQRIQGIFSMSSDWINEKRIKSQFLLLQGLSYSVNYLIKSYPQIVGMSIDQEEKEDIGVGAIISSSSKALVRNLVPFEFPCSTIADDNLNVSLAQDFITNQQSIPFLLQHGGNKRRCKTAVTASVIEEEIDDDISNFLVDDKEIISSENEGEEDEDQVEDFIDIDEEEEEENVGRSISKRKKSSFSVNINTNTKKKQLASINNKKKMQKKRN